MAYLPTDLGFIPQMPTAAMPMSQQVAGMALPVLQMPQAPSKYTLGVDTNVRPQAAAQGMNLQDLAGGLQNLGLGLAASNAKKEKPEVSMLQPMQFQPGPQMDLLSILGMGNVQAAMQAPQQPQMNLLDYVRLLGGQ